jgi:hypothetical protein
MVHPLYASIWVTNMASYFAHNMIRGGGQKKYIRARNVRSNRLAMWVRPPLHETGTKSTGMTIEIVNMFT